MKVDASVLRGYETFRTETVRRNTWHITFDQDNLEVRALCGETAAVELCTQRILTNGEHEVCGNCLRKHKTFEPRKAPRNDATCSCRHGFAAHMEGGYGRCKLGSCPCRAYVKRTEP
jgi:hypothetical protein